MCLEYRTICTDSLPRAILTQNALLMILLRGRQSSSFLHPPISVILENRDPVYLEYYKFLKQAQIMLVKRDPVWSFFRFFLGV